MIISNVFDHMACEGLMAQIANVEIINPSPAQRTTVRNAALNMARAMEKAQNILKDKLNVPALFVTPPGFCQWPPALQRFIYMVTEICKCREIDSCDLRAQYADQLQRLSSLLAFLHGVCCLGV